MDGFAAPYGQPIQRPAQWQRGCGAALVVLLHLLLLLAALRAVTQPTAKTPALHELTLILPRLRQAAPRVIDASPPRTVAPHAITIIPPIIMPPAASPAPQPDIKSFGQSLFGCAPENLANLSPEKRARCGGSGITRGDGLAVTEPASHVKNPELRAAEMAKKNTPGYVPCTSIQTTALGNTAAMQTLMVDPLCAIKEMNK